MSREKQTVNFDGLTKYIEDALSDFDIQLFSQAKSFQQENTYSPKSYDEMKDFLSSSSGFAIAPWNGKADSEAKVKKETKATIRCLPMSDEHLERSFSSGSFDQTKMQNALSLVNQQPRWQSSLRPTERRRFDQFQFLLLLFKKLNIPCFI